MKNLLILVFAGLISTTVSAQIGVDVQMGSTTHSFKGNPIFNKNESESTYYLIERGVLHYYYVNNYNGKCIQYIHSECVIKDLDLKSVDFKDYQDMGKFMYIDTKKNAKVITYTKIDDSELRGPSVDGNLTSEEDMQSTFIIIINEQEMADILLEKIKKG